MPSWEDYKTEAKARGALALELFVVQSMPAAPPETIKATLPDHLAYQRSLEEAGSLVFAGPLSDETGREMQAMGMIVYRAESFEAARVLAEGDPMHARGAPQLHAAQMVDQRRVLQRFGTARRAIGVPALVRRRAPRLLEAPSSPRSSQVSARSILGAGPSCPQRAEGPRLFKRAMSILLSAAGR